MDPHDVADAALRALESSLQNERDWKNIQHTVKEAVERVAVVLAAQFQTMGAILDRLSSLESAQHSRLDAIRREVAAELKESLLQSHQMLTERVCAHVDARLSVQKEAEAQQIAEWRAAHERHLRSEIDATRAKLSEELKTAVGEAKQASITIDDSKSEALDRQFKRLEKHVQKMENQFMQQWNMWQEKVEVSLASKVAPEDLPQTIEHVVDEKLSRTKEDHGRLESQLLSMRKELCTNSERTKTICAEELAQLKSHMHELIGIVETLQGEQASLKTLLVDQVQNGDQQSDAKRSVAKIYDAVKSVRRSVETVAKRAEIEALNEQVALIRKQVRSEIYQARYIWKEGRPTAKRTIPWTTQVLNSNCDVFVWQQSTSDQITTMVPGLYQFQAAFFTSFEPTLQVLVNGEPALIRTSIERTENFSKDVDGRVCEPRQRRLHHTSGDLVGVEISAFLALPARAVVSVCYDIDERAQGFVNIRKL